MRVLRNTKTLGKSKQPRFSAGHFCIKARWISFALAYTMWKIKKLLLFLGHGKLEVPLGGIFHPGFKTWPEILIKSRFSKSVRKKLQNNLNALKNHLWELSLLLRFLNEKYFDELRFISKVLKFAKKVFQNTLNNSELSFLPKENRPIQSLTTTTN